MRNVYVSLIRPNIVGRIFLSAKDFAKAIALDVPKGCCPIWGILCRLLHIGCFPAIEYCYMHEFYTFIAAAPLKIKKKAQTFRMRPHLLQLIMKSFINAF